MNKNWLHLTGLGLMLSFVSSVAGPLDNWLWRNPLPNGNPVAGPHTLNGVVFANGKFVAVGEEGVVSISTDVTNWIESATATTNNLNCLVFANGQFVAAGDGGVVETSIDGTNWAAQNSGTTNSLSALAYSNGKFVAVGPSAVITSTDGMSWTPAISGLGGAIGVAGGSHGFVAVTGNDQVFSSSNGTIWTGQVLTGPDTGNPFFNGALFNQIATYAGGNYLIGTYQWASSESVNVFIYRSTDGLTWTTNLLGNLFTGAGGFAYNFFMVESNNVIASGEANDNPFLQFSSNGINWFQTNSVPSNFALPFGLKSGAYGNGSYVIVASTDAIHPLPPIYTSTDGLTWTNRQHAPPPPTGPAYTFTSIATNNGAYIAASANLVGWSSNGLAYVIASNTPPLASVVTFSNKFVGVGSGGTIFLSGDGLAWTQHNSGTLNNLHGIIAGNGLLVAAGDGGAIQTSPTGTIWTSRTSGTSLSLYCAAYANGLYVAVGQLGTVLTSLDGINWTAQDSGQLNNLLSVTYGAAGFLAVGPAGTIITSPDGVNWTQQTVGTTAKFESVTFGNGYYLVTGDNSVVMTSPDGVNWIARNTGASGGQNFYGSAFLNNHFDIVGTNGTIIESDSIAPLFDLQIHPGVAQNVFSIFDTPGSSFRIQACTDLTAADWVDVATFNNAPAITSWTNATAGFSQRYYRAVSP